MYILNIVLLVTALKTVTPKIVVDITSGTNVSDILIKYEGFDIRIVNNEDIRMFKINTSNLKKGVSKLYGSQPTNVFLKKPTPWSLYEKYYWEEVKRIVKVKSARIKSTNKKPVIVHSQNFDNNFNNTIKVNTGITQTVENSVSTSWSRGSEFTITQEIEYDVNVIFSKFSGTTGISYSSQFGTAEEKTETVTVGASSSMETELMPGQSATAVLTANRGSIEVEVTYEAYLRGNVAVNYKRSYQGHHFWGPQIDKVMSSAGLSNAVEMFEVIKIGFYTDSSLNVYDKSTGLPL